MVRIERVTLVAVNISSITDVKREESNQHKREESRQHLWKPLFRKKQDEEKQFIEVKMDDAKNGVKFSGVLEKDSISQLRVGQEVVLKKIGNPADFLSGKDKYFTLLYSKDGKPVTLRDYPLPRITGNLEL